MPLSLMDTGGKLQRAAEYNLRITVELLLEFDLPRKLEGPKSADPGVQAAYIQGLLWDRGWSFWTNDPLAEIAAAIAAATAEPNDCAARDTWLMSDVKLANVLCEHGFRTYGDLTKVTAVQLLNYPGIGSASIITIRHELYKVKLWLLGDEATENLMRLRGRSLFSSHNAQEEGGSQTTRNPR